MGALRLRPGKAIIAAVLFCVGVVMVAPLVWLISQSLTERGAAFSIPPDWLPVPFTLENFQRVPELIPFGRMALNSLIVASISTFGAILTSLLAAYAFSRIRFAGRGVIFITMLGALMVPVQMTVIPVFILMRNLGLVDRLPSLWLPALINVFAIFFFRQYFNSIPRELDEAAIMDGAGHLWILFRIMTPLSGPAVAAIAIFVFEMSWNNYFMPLIFLSSQEHMTLPLGLVALQSARGGASVMVFAAITAVVLPVLIVFLAFQRHFVASIATAGIRG